MTTHDFDSTLRALQDRKPFRPFTVELVGGQRVVVDLANAFVVRDGVAGLVRGGGVPVLFDHGEVVRLVDE